MLKPLLLKLFFYSFIVNALILSSASVYSAEEVLLIIEGDLIDRIELIDEDSDADLVITVYYDLLPDDARANIEILRERLERLQPDYEVAYLAADSAEMAEVRDQIDDQWAVIQAIHLYYFTARVVDILNQAYISNFEGLLPEETGTPE
ncbi:MAG: hypothetical protein ACJZ8E_08740 [Pseudohongiellaceae bacterium]